MAVAGPLVVAVTGVGGAFVVAIGFTVGTAEVIGGLTVVVVGDTEVAGDTDDLVVVVCRGLTVVGVVRVLVIVVVVVLDSDEVTVVVGLLVTTGVLDVVVAEVTLVGAFGVTDDGLVEVCVFTGFAELVVVLAVVPSVVVPFEPRAVVAFAVVVLGFVIEPPPIKGMPAVLTVFIWAILVIVPVSALTGSFNGVGSRSLESGPLSLVLCLELESLSLSVFLLGFFMFRTTFPVDFTGTRLIFVGIVAILGFDNTSSASVDLVAAGVPSVVTSTVTVDVAA